MKLPNNAALILTPTMLGWLAFSGKVEFMPSNVLTGLSPFYAGAMAKAFDDASPVIDCERDPVTGQWVWASLEPRNAL